jgi:transcriptional regulator with XRE-family HTH domain
LINFLGHRDALYPGQVVEICPLVSIMRPPASISRKSTAAVVNNPGHSVSTKNPNPTDKHVGSRVRMRRLMLNMTQEKLADQLGITFQQVQKYEKGTNRVSASRLQKMSQILDVSISFFFEEAPNSTNHRRGSGEAVPAAYIDDFLASSDGLALVKAFMRIKEKALRRSIVDLVEAIGHKERSRSK